MNLTPISYKVVYNSKNITKDISEHLLSLTYTDKVEGETDEMELTLEDKDGLWQNEWYPGKGDTIEVNIIDDDKTLPCGVFTVDEIKLSGSKSDGDVITISNVAASITKKMRTKRNTAHENKTLRQLAQAVADRHGLTIQGTIPDVTFGRITQHRKSDLAFLSGIAYQYGIVFNVRGKILIFHKQTDLEKKEHSVSIDKTEVESFGFIDKTDDTYESANIQFHNPATGDLIKKKVTIGSIGGSANPSAVIAAGAGLVEDSDLATDDVPSGDEQEKYDKVENEQQAEIQASSSLRRKNTRIKTTSISCPGNMLLVSGNNVELTGFGKMSGIYHITEAKHKVSKSDNYKTSFEGKKVDPVPPAKYKPKKKSTSPQTVQIENLNGQGFTTATIRKVGNDEIIVIPKGFANENN